MSLWDLQAYFVRVPSPARKLPKGVILRELRLLCPSCDERHAILFAAMPAKGDVHQHVRGRTLDDFTFAPNYKAPCGVELRIVDGTVRQVR